MTTEEYKTVYQQHATFSNLFISWKIIQEVGVIKKILFRAIKKIETM